MGKSTLTKEIQSRIVEIIKKGNYQKTAYQSLGIPKRTYFNWLSEGEKAEAKEWKLTKTEETYLHFLHSIKRAIQVSRQASVKVILKAAQDGSWQAAAWFLERTDFEEFGNKSKLKHSSTNGKPNVFKVIYD